MFFDLGKAIKSRLAEFETLGREGEVIFDFRPFLDLKVKADLKNELAFCISTANSSAAAGLKFQTLLESDNIQSALRKAGVRFWRRKTEYIREAFRNFNLVERALQLSTAAARKRLLKVKGLGMKEASHYLRNVGRDDVAIIDRHILRWLTENEYIEQYGSLTVRKYAEIEKILRDIAEERRISLAELDLRLWAEMTGKVLK
ncbi:N-glycosylase/DNA lyase [Archaeoglobus neptunius]|uniref:N-glycosylase/DNA lyase n=1 Tax=Archaeoglobus neptunius TaxID=2798580 RepID=UPI001926848B|nr:N-glycosylase/DNA lyase [Archaeoglobus neptunius]